MMYMIFAQIYNREKLLLSQSTLYPRGIGVLIERVEVTTLSTG